MQVSLTNPQAQSKAQNVTLAVLCVCAFAIPISVTATTVSYLLATLLALIFVNWQRRLTELLHNPAIMSFWLLFALFLIGMSYSNSSHELMIEDLQKHHWLLITPLLALIITSNVWRERILNAFVAAMLVTLVLSYLKGFGLDPIEALFPQELGAINVFFGQIVQTFFLSIAAFLLGYRALIQQRWRPLNLTLFILIGINVVFFSIGRTGYVIFTALSLYLAWLRWGSKGLLITLLISVLTLAAAYQLATPFKTRVTAVTTDYHQYQSGDSMTPIGQRLGMWQNARLLIEKRPWLGYGTGGIRQAMRDHLTQQQINRSGLVNHVENSLLNFWLQFGVVGILLFLAAMITQTVMSFYLPLPYRHLMLGFLLAFLLGSLANSFFVSFCETHLYSLFAATCFSSYPYAKNNN